MQAQTIKLIDPTYTVIAIAQITAYDEAYRGKVDLTLMPAQLRQLFTDYEEIVNGQMFSLLDEIEEQIHALQLKLRFDNGAEVEIEELQIYPSTNRISLKLVQEPVAV